MTMITEYLKIKIISPFRSACNFRKEVLRPWNYSWIFTRFYLKIPRIVTLILIIVLIRRKNKIFWFSQNCIIIFFSIRKNYFKACPLPIIYNPLKSWQLWKYIIFGKTICVEWGRQCLFNLSWFITQDRLEDHYYLYKTILFTNLLIKTR